MAVAVALVGAAVIVMIRVVLVDPVGKAGMVWIVDCSNLVDMAAQVAQVVLAEKGKKETVSRESLAFQPTPVVLRKDQN